MNGSVKRVILGEAIVLVAWLVIMFVCKNALMNPIVFAMSLGFGVLAFAVASISATMSDKQSTVKSTTEIHYLPIAFSCAYFVVVLLANTYFAFVAYGWGGSTIPVVANVVLLVVLVLVQMGLGSYARRADQKVAAVVAKTVQTAQFGSYVGQLLAVAEDAQVKAELKALKDDISFSSNMSQPHVQEIERQFFAALEAVSNSMSADEPADVTVGLVHDARNIWKKRNAALTAVK